MERQNGMKRTLLLMMLALTAGLFAQTSPITLDEIFTAGAFKEHKIENVEWRPGDRSFTFTRSDSSGESDIYEHDVKSGKSAILVSHRDLVFQSKKIDMSSYQWIGDGTYLLIEGPQKSIWRHSRQAPFYLLNVKTKELSPLSNGNPHLRNVKLSPDGTKVGFVRDHNIYVVNLADGREQAVTSNGSETMLNGEFDWVYEEEFGLADAWRWSPDSKKIAFWQFDQSRVKEFHLVDEMTRYNTVSSLRYPKVGEQNAVVKIGVADLAASAVRWMDLGTNDDIYVPRIFWTNSSSVLAIVRLNRKQNFSELMMANTSDGTARTIITDSDSDWVDVDTDIDFLKTKDQIVLTSEKSGYRHAYLYDYNGTLIQQITKGDWEITDICGVDEKNGWLYFYGKKDSPLEQNIYRVKLNGTGLARIAPGSGWHTPDFSPSCQYFIDSYSTSSAPTVTTLRAADGKEIRVLEQGTIEALRHHVFSTTEFLKFRTTDGAELNAYMIKPVNFDPAKKYPVIVYGYGGPGSQMVVNQWGDVRALWHHYMTEQGYIIFCVDNRGTGGRGKAFKNLAYGDLSKWAVGDQIEGAKYLATLPYVDAKRIGFWGWSGGGYLTLGMLTRGADYFSAGIAVAPVSDFLLYDDIWTERYMGLLTENAEGYKAANLQNYAGMLRGKLLVIHGTGDDNVHFQNTLQFINTCISQNKQVDLFLYPNRNHGITGGTTRIHLFTKMTDYFLRNL